MSVAWTQAVASWLGAHRVYPEEAHRRGEEGNVLVRFTVEPSGSVVSVAVVRSSGSAWLDAAAEAMLRGATLPPFAPFMRQACVTVTAQIRYALEGGSAQADGYYLIAVATLHGVDQGSYTPVAHAEGRATCMVLRKQMLVHPVLGVPPPYALRWTCMTDAQWFTRWTTLRPAPGQSK